MIVRVEQTVDGGSISVEEPHDFMAFHVELAGMDVADADRLFLDARAGRITGESEAEVSTEALGRLTGLAEDADWQDGLAGMLAYARSKGWLSDDGAFIKAHLEYPG